MTRPTTGHLCPLALLPQYDRQVIAQQAQATGHSEAEIASRMISDGLARARGDGFGLVRNAQQRSRFFVGGA